MMDAVSWLLMKAFIEQNEGDTSRISEKLLLAANPSNEKLGRSFV
jgi:hypothetical protein